MKNITFSDEEMILCYRQGHTLMMSILIDKYKNYADKIIHYFLNKFSLANSFYLELSSVYIASIAKAMDNYQFGNILFLTFFRKVFVRDLNNEIKFIIQNKYTLTSSLSLDETISDSEIPFLENLTYENSENEVKSYAFTNETTLYLSSPGKNRKREEFIKKIILLRIEGYSYREIAKKMNVELGVIKRIFSNAKDNEIFQELTLTLK